MKEFARRHLLHLASAVAVLTLSAPAFAALFDKVALLPANIHRMPAAGGQ